MKRAGTVVGTAQGVVVLRSDDDSYPELGTQVLNSDLTDVGDVVDVFGPVEGPYLAVSPAERPGSAGLVGQTLYARE